MYDSQRTRWSLDYAARWSVALSEIDGASSFFHGTGREPQLLAGSTSQPALLPAYDLIDQLGLELQWTRGPWLWKAESIVRRGQRDSYLETTLQYYF